jgi:hypothetical protein
VGRLSGAVGDETASWQPDPYGIHELRFFSADGKPTLLVSDGGRTSYDRPPASQPPPAQEPPATSEPERSAVPTRPGDLAAEPPPPPFFESPVVPDPPVVTVGMQAEVRGAVSTLASPSDGFGEHGTVSRRTAFRVLPTVAHSSADRGDVVERNEPESLSRPRKVAYAVVFAAFALSVLGLAYVHLRPHGEVPTAHGGGATTTTHSGATGSRTVTTTTAALPATLSSSADAAANTLVSSWSTGNKPAALAVATPTAVATLFAAPYTSGLAIARGCSTAFSPIVCTFGPPGGASPSDAIYQVLVSQTAGGWYVSSVRIQG